MAIVPYTSSHLAAKRIRENQRKRAEYDSDISFIEDKKVSKSDKCCEIIMLTVLILIILFMYLLAIDAIFKIGIIIEPLYPDKGLNN
ncbi:hypothetical protein [Elizabethkingia meningoseptica]|uniref:hypothetical protein n=1 Tax=Elizabethkingia meningoseptica TaxID=238 RepID=UPI0038922234